MTDKASRYIDAMGSQVMYSVVDEKFTQHLDGLTNKRVAVHVHIFYLDLVEEIAFYLCNIPVRFNLFLSVPETIKCDEDKLKETFLKIDNVSNVDVRITPNVGRDIAPMLCTFRDELLNSDYLLHIHTKKTPEDVTLKDWRIYLFNHLLGSSTIVTYILNNLAHGIGMIVPPNYTSYGDITGWGPNLCPAQEVIDISTLHVNLKEEYPVISFPQGTMFWSNVRFLKHFFELPLTYADFPQEPIARDGTVTHALERLFCVWGKNTGMKINMLFTSDDEYRFWMHMKIIFVERWCELQDMIKSSKKARKRLDRIRKLIYALIFSVAVIIFLITLLVSRHV